jgi:hypothetical protein
MKIKKIVTYILIILILILLAALYVKNIKPEVIEGTFYSKYHYTNSNIPNNAGDYRFELNYSYTINKSDNCTSLITKLYIRRINTIGGGDVQIDGQIIVDEQIVIFNKNIDLKVNGKILIGENSFKICNKKSNNYLIEGRAKIHTANDYLDTVGSLVLD